MNSHLETVAFINSIRCRSRWCLFLDVAPLCMLLAGLVSLWNVAADGSSSDNILLEGDVHVALCVFMLHAKVSNCTYVSQSFDGWKQNDKILQLMCGYIARRDRLSANYWQRSSASQPLRKGITSWGNCGNIWAVFNQYVVWKAIRIYPTVKK